MRPSVAVMAPLLICVAVPQPARTTEARPAATRVARTPAGAVGLESIVASLLQAFDAADVVALGEAHRRRQDSDLRIALVRHADFARRVHNIVVEFGNARYQSLLDRYVRGEDVRPEQLQPLWRDTTQPQVWDSTVYEEFFRTVRDVNQKLPTAGKVRVWAGDPPIDWSTVNDRAAAQRFLAQRDAYPTSILRQLAETKQKTLVIYGMGHVLRSGGLTAFASASHIRIYVVAVVGRSSPASEDLESSIESSSRPVLVTLAGAPAGNINGSRLVPPGAKIVKGLQSRPLAQILIELLGLAPTAPPPPKADVRTSPENAPFRDLADACVYLGAGVESETWIKPDPSLYTETTYGAEIDRRRRILGLDTPRL